MKKILTAFSFAMLGVAAMAQETYDNAQLATKDLNGTARYVGMGGAMEALGADISTMNTNPAGVGLFRRSMVTGSFGFNSLSGVKDIGKDKTKASFDHVGFVYVARSGRHSYLNFGVSYTKSRNFNQIVTAAGRLNGASQNKVSSMKNYNDFYRLEDHNGELTSQWGSNDYPDLAYNQVDYLYSNALLGGKNSELIGMNANGYKGGYYLGDANGALDASGNPRAAYYDATGYDFRRGSSGYIGEYNFNLSGNSKDRFYWGLTFGMYDVNYRSASVYKENLVNSAQKAIGDVTIADERTISGSGFDVKAGVIFRPIEESPFRVGLYLHTPTWYDLKTENRTTLLSNLAEGYGKGNQSTSGRYDYKFYTPWRFGGSLGYTVGNYLALGATYEYADYSYCDIRVNDGGSYDYWGNYYEETSRDEAMKNNIKSVLKGVSTLKIGAEYKPTRNVALRLGYNYVSPMYNKNGYKDGTLNSYSNYYSSTTDYTNWKATDRVTAGIGYAYKKFSVDLAYQYSRTEGEFFPFMSYSDLAAVGGDKTKYDAGYDNFCDGKKVTDNRHQVLLTLGYKF